MSNLIRGKQPYLINDLSPEEIGFYFAKPTTGGNTPLTKHLVLKKLALDMPAYDNLVNKVIIKRSKDTQPKLVTVSLNYRYDGLKTIEDFEIQVTKKAEFDGNSSNAIELKRLYSFKFTSFTTAAAGALNDADKTAIMTGLAAVINADVQLNQNATNQGACVFATVNGTTLILKAKKNTIDFVVGAPSLQFTSVITTEFEKPALTNDEIWKLFAIREEFAGQKRTLPQDNIDYACVSIFYNSPAYDNVVPSGFTPEQQQIDLYVNEDQLETALFATATDATTNAASMADTVATATKSIYDYLKLWAGDANVVMN